MMYNYTIYTIPLTGQEIEVQQPINVHNEFKVGDRVRVDLDVARLKSMQEGHGGWNQRMAQVITSYTWLFV